MSDILLSSFAYTAQTFEGRPTTGTIDAADLDDASKRLADLRLRVIRLDPAQRPVRAKPLSGDDFAAFNQQLAHLTGAGLPIEQGLRLIAEDLQHGGLAQSIRDVSAELERGVPLGDAFKLHEKQFPPLYGILIEAGVRTGNLPSVLLNLGRHLELVARLRAAMWRAVAYPLMVIAGLLFVMIFMGHFVLPQFVGMYREFGASLPTVTLLLFQFAQITPILIVIAIVLIVGMPLVWMFLRAAHLDRAAADLALPLPLIGPILRRNLIARWCDAMKIAVLSGMDLPAAVKLAGDVVGSPALRRDGEKIVTQLAAGGFLDHLIPQQAFGDSDSNAGDGATVGGSKRFAAIPREYGDDVSAAGGVATGIDAGRAHAIAAFTGGGVDRVCDRGAIRAAGFVVPAV